MDYSIASWNGSQNAASSKSADVCQTFSGKFCILKHEPGGCWTKKKRCLRLISHCLPAVCGKCGLAKAFRVGSASVFASLFDQRPSPAKATRGRPHTAGRQCVLQESRDCGTKKHNGRKFAQARHGEFVLWRTAKTFIDTSTDITNSASVIPSEVEESLDIISDTATRARLRSAAASSCWP